MTIEKVFATIRKALLSRQKINQTLDAVFGSASVPPTPPRHRGSATAQGKKGDANALASNLLNLVRQPRQDRAQFAQDVLAAIGAEKIFGDTVPGRSGSALPKWQEIANVLRGELTGLAEKGQLTPEEVARLADLISILRYVLTEEELVGFIGSLQEIGADPKFQEARGFAVVVNNAQQAHRLIRTTLSPESGIPAQRRLIIGVDAKKREALKKELSDKYGVSVDALEREGTLGFIPVNKQTTALSFITAAEDLMFKGQTRVKLNLLIMDGVALPPSFLALSPKDIAALREAAFLFFVTETLQAIELDAHRLPDLMKDWNTIRTRLIQA